MPDYFGLHRKLQIIMKRADLFDIVLHPTCYQPLTPPCPCYTNSRVILNALVTAGTANCFYMPQKPLYLRYGSFRHAVLKQQLFLYKMGVIDSKKHILIELNVLYKESFICGYDGIPIRTLTIYAIKPNSIC